MTIKPEELESNGYLLMDELDHSAIIPFVRTYLRKRTAFAVFYTVSNIVIAGIIVAMFCIKYRAGAFNYFCYGLALAFALIPLHEYLHVLAYKSQGAKHTSYDVNWKKFYFLAIADRFVAGRKEFQIVALTPFVFITTTLIILLFFATTLWSFTIAGVLLTHTACCSGDFGLLSYFDHHSNKEVVTYDDRMQGVSYFYGKPPNSTT